jgi:hypothetical protein
MVAEHSTDLLRRVHTLRADSRPRWGRMICHQMICHVSDGYRAVLGERPLPDAGGRWHRTLLKWGTLYVPVRHPRSAPTHPGLDQEIAGSRPVGFVVDLSALEQLVLRFAAGPADGGGYHHPVFGPLTRAQAGRWAYLHLHHHLRQFGV